MIFVEYGFNFTHEVKTMYISPLDEIKTMFNKNI